MWRRAHERQDPAKVIERRESPPVRTYAGCTQIRLVDNPLEHRRELRCAKGRSVGERCKDYQERTNG